MGTFGRVGNMDRQDPREALVLETSIPGYVLRALNGLDEEAYWCLVDASRDHVSQYDDCSDLKVATQASGDLRTLPSGARPAGGKGLTSAGVRSACGPCELAVMPPPTCRVREGICRPQGIGQGQGENQGLAEPDVLRPSTVRRILRGRGLSRSQFPPKGRAWERRAMFRCRAGPVGDVDRLRLDAAGDG